jgi:ABC-type glycerol-3-phosphate transport system substrate-binding protein
MNAIVDSWNKSHAGIQVHIVPVDVNSVHDKLLTSFVGGAAADIVHDEAADIAGFTQQGYLANLSPLIPKALKAESPQSVWNVTNFGHKIAGVPIMLQTYNVFANMTILKVMHDRTYVDKTLDPAGIGLSGSAVLPAFFGGKCAMTVQGNYQVQGMIEQAPKGFNWAMFPPLKGKTQAQAAKPQTLSISAQSQHKAEAMQFIAYALNSQNMAKLSAGDWLIPAAPAAAKVVVKSTKHYGSWRNAVSAVPFFVKANWVLLTPYARWKAEVATPAFRTYLGNQMSLEDLTKTLVDGWVSIRGT